VPTRSAIAGKAEALHAAPSAVPHKLRFFDHRARWFGGTVAYFAAGRLVMTAPAALPLVDKLKFKEESRENC